MDPLKQEAEASAAIDAGSIRRRRSWVRWAVLARDDHIQLYSNKEVAVEMSDDYVDGRVVCVRITEIPEDER